MFGLGSYQYVGEAEAVNSLRASIRPEILEAWENMESDKCDTCKGLKGKYILPNDLKFLEDNLIYHKCYCKVEKPKPVEEKPKPKTVTIKNNSVPSLF